MTNHIQGPKQGKTQMIREAGGTLLERPPARLAPTGTYVCVVRNSDSDVAAVVDGERDLHDFSDPHDVRPKEWLHVSPEVLARLLAGPASV